MALLASSAAIEPLLASEQLCRPSASSRERTRISLRSSPSFARRFDRVQVLGAPSLDEAVRAESRPGRSIARTHGHTGCINALSWSPDGRFLASGSDDTKICLWKMGSEPTTGPANAGYYNPASGCPESAPKLHLGLSEVIHTGHTRNIFSVKWSPVSSRRLFSCAGDDQVRVFDLGLAAERGRSASFIRQGQHSWHEWGDGDGALLKTLRCHTDRVKRIATDTSNDVFLTCAEDGTVRQHDLRVPHFCRGDGQGCGPPLVSYAENGISLYTLSISKVNPSMFVVGGTSPWVFLHDRRMMPLATLKEWGVHHRPGYMTQCVRRFGLLPPPPPAKDGESETSRRPRPRRSRAHVTAAKLSDWNPRDLIVSYSGDSVYLFDVFGDAADAPKIFEGGTLSESSPGPLHPQKRDRSAAHEEVLERRDAKRITSYASRIALRNEDLGGEGVASADPEENSNDPEEVPKADGFATQPTLSETAGITDARMSGNDDASHSGNLDGAPEQEDNIRTAASDAVPQEGQPERGEIDGLEAEATQEAEESSDEEAIFLGPGRRGPEPNIDVPSVHPTRSYAGHVNEQTVKDVNFAGGNDSLVVSGSDDGNFFVWDKATGELMNILEGDSQVVNVLQGHPHMPVMAVSGIDDTAKIFAPVARPPEERTAAKMEQREEITTRNRARQGARGRGFGVAVPRHILMALLAQHGQGGEDGECVIQ